MALAKIYKTVQDSAGNVVPQVLCTITDHATGTRAPIYQDKAGTITLQNPFYSDAIYGSLSCYIAPGRYDFLFEKQGYVFEQQVDFQVFSDPGTIPAGGSPGQVQVNSDGVLGGSTGLTLNATQVTDIVYADPVVGRAALGLGTLATLSAITSAEVTNGTLTYADIQDVTDNRLLGRSGGSTGPMQEITLGAGLSLSSGVITAPAVPLDPTLATIAALTPTTDQGVYFTGPDVAATYPLTSFARTLLDDADAATARATLGLGATTQQLALPWRIRYLSSGPADPQGFADAQTEVLAADWQVPATLGSGTITFWVWLRAELAVGGSRLSVQVLRYVVGAAPTVLTGPTASTWTPGATTTQVFSVTVATSAVLPNDLLRLELTRLGLDGADTLAGMLLVDGVSVSAPLTR